MNFDQLKSDVMVRLGETQTALIATYLTGVNSNTPVTGYDTLSVIGGWLNDGQNDLARHYYPITDNASYSWPMGQKTARFAQFTCVANAANSVFAIRRLSLAGTPLTWADRAAIENWYPTMDADPLGIPQWYYDDGIEGVGIYPFPSSAMSATTGSAPIIPAPLLNPNDVPVFPADRHILLSWYACAQCLRRNTEDAQLASRGDTYWQMYLDGAGKILDRVWRADDAFANDVLAARPQAAQ